MDDSSPTPPNPDPHDADSPSPEWWVNGAPEQPRTPVPMFPLGGVFLFPRTVLPLHVFEPRYRQMVEDSLDAHGRIVIGTVTEDGPLRTDAKEKQPSVLPIAGIGEIVKHEKLEDGRFLIWLVGLSRVEHQEVESDRLYRKVVCRNLAEVPATESEVADLKPQLEEAVQARAPDDVELPDNADVGFLTDVLLQLLRLPKERLAPLFTEPNVVVRAEQALAEHRAQQLKEWRGEAGDGGEPDGDDPDGG